MTEGGGTCILEAHKHPDKLHTVGRPAEGHDLRLIDEAGREAAAGRGRRGGGPLAGGMMTGYHGQPDSDARGRVVRRQTASASSAPATSAALTPTAS
jgi:acyl-coenzyme A synthetase/AMP-(fatty) acid ligase